MLTSDDCEHVLEAIDAAVTAGACWVAERDDPASAMVWRTVAQAHSKKARQALADRASTGRTRRPPRFSYRVGCNTKHGNGKMADNVTVTNWPQQGGEARVGFELFLLLRNQHALHNRGLAHDVQLFAACVDAARSRSYSLPTS